MGQDPLLQQQGALEAAAGGQAEKPQINAPFPQPPLNVLVAALEQLKGDVGVPLGKRVDQVRQNVHRYAEKGADAHLPHLQPVKLGGLTG